MSLDSGPSAALLSRKHDIAQTVLSRKRKLCELYAVTTSPDPVPPYLDLLRDLSPPQHPIALFLGQNDLEKGRYFRVSSLPSRPLPSAYSSRSLRSSNTASPARQPQLARDGELEAQTHRNPSNQPSLYVDAADRDDEPAESNQDNAARASRDRTKPKLNIAAQNETRELRRSKPPTPIPIADAQSDLSTSRLAPDKQSRPESPPYSPGSEAIAAGSALIDDASLRKARDGSANVLTPSKDEHDDISHSQERPPDKVDSQGASDVQTAHHAQTRHAPSVTDAADTVSSPSSATGHQSANTPRSEPRSPFTSPDEDNNNNTQQASTPAQPGVDDGGHDALGNDSKFSPRAASASNNTASVKEGTSATIPRPQISVQSKGEAPSADSVGDYNQHHKNLNAITAKEDGRGETEERPAVRPGVLETAQVQDGRDQEKHDADPMDVDRPEHTARDPLAGPPRIPKSSPVDKSRVAKSMKRQCKVIKVGKSKQLAIRSSNRDRERMQISRLKGNRQDYFRPQVVRDVLNAVFRQDLNSLLTNCNVTLTTTDWMLHNEEELFRILLQRTLHLQNTQRWSLKQLAPAEDPPPERCHWDYVLQEAKWLRTDFREERKQKFCVARQLASWCAEWVNSTADERIRLQKPAAISSSLTELSQDRQNESTVKIDPSPSASNTDEGVFPFAGDEELLFASPNNVLPAGIKARISKKVLSKIPEYSSSVSLGSSLMNKKISAATARSSRDDSRQNSVLRGASLRGDRAVSDIPPQNTDCALFLPEYKQMRNRLNAVWIYKPPQLPMPSQGFYEHRTPSQWTWEDDQQLRQNVKDYGVNWHLISQNMTARQEFYTTSDRRTPWECYERLLILDPPQHDMQARQYLKHFHFRIEKARASFEEQQSFIRTQAQQHARDVGQPLPTQMHKRFPTPTRVDRKPNKRFLAMLDASRKLARKRETALNKQEKSQQADAQAQRPPAPPSNGNAHTPQYFSRLKHEREVKDMERMREQQRAALVEQQRRQAGYQASLTNGIGQQMRNGMASGQVATNGHLAVPSHNQFRPPSHHPGMQAGLPNGMPPNAQMAMGNRSQATMQNQQRLAPQMNGQAATNQENIARLMQQQHQQQQRLQQLNRGSPNAANAIPNLNMLASYANNQFASTSDDMQSPNMSLQPQGNPGSHQSPHIAQALAAAVGSSQQVQQLVGGQNAPQALSSGHVPHFMTLQHQIHKSNPSMSSKEARAKATEQLQYLMRQNAINAASGMANSGVGNGGAETGVGSQSPYPPAAQMQSPFQQNGILASNHQGRGQSPNTPQQQQYQAQLRQHMYNQQQRQHQMAGASGSSGSGGDSSGPSSSPGLAQALPSNLGLGNMGIGVQMMGGFAGGSGGNNRAPTPGGSMRPPSRATSGIDMTGLAAGQHTGEQQRPGSAAGMAHSPSLSAQGFTGQG